MSYDQSQYPRALDFFIEVADGSGPANKVTASLVNKVQNAVLALENHVQYSATCPNATGCAVLVGSYSYTLAANLPAWHLVLPVSLGFSPPQMAAIAPVINNQRSPFGRGFALFAFADAYHIVNGVRTFYPCRCGINVMQENNNAILTVDVVKDSQWLGGDAVDVTVMVARP